MTAIMAVVPGVPIEGADFSGSTIRGNDFTLRGFPKNHDENCQNMIGRGSESGVIANKTLTTVLSGRKVKSFLSRAIR